MLDAPHDFERQFLRLVGSCNRIAQFFVHPFTVAGVPRQGEAHRHVQQYYKTFEQIRDEGVDALIITGANPQQSDLTAEPFWEQMIEVMAWARASVCSTVYSCLATHAALHAFHDQRRQKLLHPNLSLSRNPWPRRHENGSPRSHDPKRKRNHNPPRKPVCRSGAKNSVRNLRVLMQTCSKICSMQRAKSVSTIHA